MSDSLLFDVSGKSLLIQSVVSSLTVYQGYESNLSFQFYFSKFAVYFATASADRTTRLWSTEFTHPLRIFAGHIDSVNVSYNYL